MPQFDAWIMTYHKDYCKKLNSDSITRKDYNKEYNAVPFDKIQFIKRQLLLGYTCQDAEDFTICRGPGVTFILKSSTDGQPCKLLKLRMSLNRRIASHNVHKFENSTLELENDMAIWTFK